MDRHPKCRGGVLQVVAERRVRGSVERTYALDLLAAQMRDDEIEAMSLDDHAQAFMGYVAGLLSDFDRYLAHFPVPGRDRDDYRMAAIWLTGEEYADFLRDFNRVLRARTANGPSKGRRRRVVYHVALPAPEAAGPTEQE